MDHPHPDDLLTPKPTPEVAAHIASCAVCRAEHLLYLDIFEGIDSSSTFPPRTTAPSGAASARRPPAGTPLEKTFSVLTTLRQVAATLCAMHQKGQSYGDLSLADIRVSADGQLQLQPPAPAPPGPLAAGDAPGRAPEHRDGGRSPAGDRFALGHVIAQLIGRGVGLPDPVCALSEALRRERPGDRPGDLELLTTLSLLREDAAQRYRFRFPLGTGGMGEVICARDEVLRRDVAIKKLHPHLGQRPVQQERFISEAQTIAQLQHPGIVPIFEHGCARDGLPYYTMPVVQGQTLAMRLAALHAAVQPHQWPEPPAPTLHGLVATLQKVCEAVGYAHSRGVVHRDLKPDNIMLGQHGEVWVMDWGLSGTLDVWEADTGIQTVRSEAGSRTLAGTVAGTPAYMSPEQASGERPGPQSDVYALGTILYELLSGQRPYPSAAPRQLIAAIQQGAPPPLQARLTEAHPPIPDGLQRICAQAMQRSPADRFPTATELGVALSQWLAGAERRQSARTVVERARQLQHSSDQHAAAAAGRSAEAQAALEAGDIHAAWLALSAAREEDATAQELARRARQRLQGALVVDAALPEAHRALAESYWAGRLLAIRARDEHGLEAATGLVRAHLDALAPSDPTRQRLTGWLDHDDRQPTSPMSRGTLHGHRPALEAMTSWWEAGGRALCLVGTAGVGKTHLAEHCGRYIARGAQTLYCSLASATTTAGIVRAVAGTLGIPLRGADPIERIGHALSGYGDLLLVADNLEQLEADLSETLGRWLDMAPRLRLLATSRTRLPLAGGQVLTVHPLPSLAAAEMFEAVARQARPGFRITQRNLGELVQLLAALDHIPLAIELAAARLGSLSLAEIRSRLSDRFALLRGRQRDPAARALQGALEASWELLSADEQNVLARCSVFSGGFRLDAAEDVVQGGLTGAQVLDCLEALIEDHLVLRTERAAAPRFSMLVSIQDFARKKLGDQEASAIDAHARHYARLGDPAWLAALFLKDGAARFQRLMEERENLLAGLTAQVAGSTGCAEAMMRIWSRMGPFQQGIEPLRRLQGGPLSALETLRLMRNLGTLLKLSGQLEQAQQHLDDALRQARQHGWPEQEAQVLHDLALLAFRRGEHTEAVPLSEAALSAYRQVGDRPSEGILLGNLGNLLISLGQKERADTCLMAALAIHREVGNRYFEGVVLANIGIARYERGQLGEARSFCRQALELHRAVGNRLSEGITLANLGLYHYEAEDFEQAAAFYAAALRIHRELGDRRSEALALGNLGNLHHARGEPEAALAFLQDSIHLARQTFPFAAAVFQGTLACIRAEQGHLQSARDLLEDSASQIRGRHPVELARLLCKRTTVELLAGDLDASQRALREAEALLKEQHVRAGSPLDKLLQRLRAELAAATAGR